MDNELLRLIYDYSVEGKLADKNYIEKLIDIVVNSKSLDKYICKLEISTAKNQTVEEKNALAYYQSGLKKIEVCLSAIDEILDAFRIYSFLFNKIEKRFFNNLLITQIVLHEIEHANQYRMIKSEKELEAEILKLSLTRSTEDVILKLLKEFSFKELEVYFMFKQKIYEENYNICPEERLAEIKSHEEILSVLSHIKDTVPNLIKFEHANKSYILLSGFHYHNGFVVSPTILYLKRIGMASQLCQFNWYDENYVKCLEKSKMNYSFENRLKYGLMIDHEEFQYLNKLKNSPK